MKKWSLVVISLLSLLLILACGGQLPDIDPESGGGGPSGGVPTTGAPAPEVVGEWVLMACALIDANGNGAVDAADERLAGGQLVVDLADGTGFGGVTDLEGCASAALPGAPGDEAGFYPITLQMLAPAGSGYRHLGPETVTLVYPDTSAAFLFAPED
jgi:hypothetical protein